MAATSTTLIVIGSGFAGLAAATVLADQGLSVILLEKNARPGGRAGLLEAEGFRFDTGPSWYWMPDVFEAYFGRFGKKPSDYYDLQRLDPAYRIWYSSGEMDLPADPDALSALFEQYEAGSAAALRRFLAESAYKYKTGMGEFVYKPGDSILEFADVRLLKAAFRLHLFRSVASYVRRFFSQKELIRLLEFPSLFLGATPANTPALYSMMNYADLVLGTWYPMGGMYRVVEAMYELARQKGVQFHFNTPATAIRVSEGRVTGVDTPAGYFDADAVIAAADYQHVEQQLLPQAFRRYGSGYWDRRVLAPSCLLYFVGIDKKIPRLRHHNLFFDEALEPHAAEIYTEPQWPTKPLFYVCAPSVSDPSVAPPGAENLFILIPVAAGLEDSEAIRADYFERVLRRLEKWTGEEIRSHICYQRSYAQRDFAADFNSFKGNAYGLANTLRQTAFLKPRMRSRLPNLFFAGQMTTPGPGVPPSLISGQVAAGLALKYLSRHPKSKPL